MLIFVFVFFCEIKIEIKLINLKCAAIICTMYRDRRCNTYVTGGADENRDKFIGTRQGQIAKTHAASIPGTTNASQYKTCQS